MSDIGVGQHQGIERHPPRYDAHFRHTTPPIHYRSSARHLPPAKLQRLDVDTLRGPTRLSLSVKCSDIGLLCAAVCIVSVGAHALLHSSSRDTTGPVQG